MTGQVRTEGDETSQPRRLTELAWMIAIGCAALGTGYAIRRQEWGWGGSALNMAIIMALATLFVRYGARRDRRLGALSAAGRRYRSRILGFAGLYTLVLFGAAWAFRGAGVGRPWLWGVAFLPALAVMGMIWAMGRQLLEEADEYLRARLVVQSLVATGGLLVITTIWGFLEQFGLVIHVPAWATVPLFGALLPLGKFYWPKRP